MSRYSTRIEGTEVVVGWEPLLSTYFGIVRDSPKADDPLVWVGTGFRELPGVENLMDVMPFYARGFIGERATRLYGDRDEGR